jgi:hypothetical protein
MRPKAISGPASATTDLANRYNLGVEFFRRVVDRSHTDRSKLLNHRFVRKTC